MSETCCKGASHRDSQLDQNLLRRLNRIEGQVRGIKGMIEKDVYCDDILTQVTAVGAALDAVSKTILDNHIRHCITEKIQAGEMEAVDELIKTVGRMLR